MAKTSVLIVTEEREGALMATSKTEAPKQFAPEKVFLKACHPASPNHNCGWSVSKTAEDSVEYVRADSLRATQKKLREALEPFAKLASAYESFDGQHDSLDADEVVSAPLARLTVGQLRAARAALAEANKEME